MLGLDGFTDELYQIFKEKIILILQRTNFWLLKFFIAVFLFPIFKLLLFIISLLLLVLGLVCCSSFSS